MPRTRDAKAHAKKRKDILKAAEALFLQNGFHQTGMAAICEAAAMSPGALYRYFPSKTDIILAFVEDEIAETTLWLDQLANAKDFKMELIENLIDAMQEVADPEYGQLASEIAAEAGRNEDVGQALQGAAEEAVVRLAQLIRSHVSAPKSDPKTAARMIAILLDGAIGLGTALPPRKKLRSAVRVMVESIL